MDKAVAQKVQKKLELLIESFRKQLSKVRTERASPALIDSVSVLCYGGARSLKSVAQVVSEGSSTLLVTPHDPSLGVAIEKALLSANLSIGVKRATQMLVITVPPLTQERRVEIARHLKNDSELVAVSMRNVRRDGNDELKKAKKDKVLTEDSQKKCEKIIQKYLDDAIVILTVETKSKIEEIMKI